MYMVITSSIIVSSSWKLETQNLRAREHPHLTFVCTATSATNNSLLEPFAVLPCRNKRISRHICLNLSDKQMTTGRVGRINQFASPHMHTCTKLRKKLCSMWFIASSIINSLIIADETQNLSPTQIPIRKDLSSPAKVPGNSLMISNSATCRV